MGWHAAQQYSAAAISFLSVGELQRQRTAGEEELENLSARAGELEQALAGRDEEIRRLRDGLEAFKARYRHEVGTLYQQLDELEAALAEAELGELAREVGDAASAPSPVPVDDAPRFTSDAIRKLFRDVAKAIHPDLAQDESARGRRHALMAEANRAYAEGDEEQLRRILLSWEKSPEAVRGSDPAAHRQRLTRRIAQLEERLAAIDAEFDHLKTSPLWHLKAQVDDAAAKGRDLVAEMVRRLKRDILVATNRLAAMR